MRNGVFEADYRKFTRPGISGCLWAVCATASVDQLGQFALWRSRSAMAAHAHAFDFAALAFAAEFQVALLADLLWRLRGRA
jgi:hypothetical protein